MIHIGSYRYSVANFEVKNLLKLLAKKSTELTEVCLSNRPEDKVIRSLFEKNNVTTFRMYAPITGWYPNISTYAIKELHVQFQSTSADSISFEGVGIYGIIYGFSKISCVIIIIIFSAAIPKHGKIGYIYSVQFVVKNLASCAWTQVFEGVCIPW